MRSTVNKSMADIKKVLLVFDLSKTLFFLSRPSRATSYLQQEILKNLKAITVDKDLQIYHRDGRNDLLDYLFVKVLDSMINETG